MQSLHPKSYLMQCMLLAHLYFLRPQPIAYLAASSDPIFSTPQFTVLHCPFTLYIFIPVIWEAHIAFNWYLTLTWSILFSWMDYNIFKTQSYDIWVYRVAPVVFYEWAKDTKSNEHFFKIWIPRWWEMKVRTQVAQLRRPDCFSFIPCNLCNLLQNIGHFGESPKSYLTYIKLQFFSHSYLHFKEGEERN